jgi:hypothetical protein
LNRVSGGRQKGRIRFERMLAQANLGEFDRVLVAAYYRTIDEFILTLDLGLTKAR